MPAKVTRRKVKRSRSPASVASRRRSAAAANTTTTVTATSRRRPLGTSNKQCDERDIWSKLVVVFNESQYVNKLDECIAKMIDIYASSDYNVFEELFRKALKKILQSEHNNYFKQACFFLCKILKQLDDDRVVRCFIEVADHYMQITHEDCRLNATFLVSKYLALVEEIDEQIYSVLKATLARRIRDKKAAIRLNAVLAACKFQDYPMIKEAFDYHFRHDPDQSVRKALVQTMDPDIFSCDFLIDATQDYYEQIRTSAYQRLAKIPPNKLKLEQLHRVLHNGLFERSRGTSYAFKSSMMVAWLPELYDGLDLVKLIDALDVINQVQDIKKLLEQLHSHDLETPALLSEGESVTKLHAVVLKFRESWLDLRRLPAVDHLDEKLVIVWLSLIDFCKKNQVTIKTIKDPASQRLSQEKLSEPDESIESIINSQEIGDEQAALYELLMPDLVHLVEFVKEFVRYTYKILKKQTGDNKLAEKYEFIYQNLMSFMSTYQIGDESELKVVQEVMRVILSENLLTDKFSNYIPPIIKCLKPWVFHANSNLLVNYVSELIHNIRSELDDKQQMDKRQDKEDDENDDGLVPAPTFKHDSRELLKCLQMYYACLENVKLNEVPMIMKNHLNCLSFEALSLRDDVQVRVWMVACNGITAFMDRSFAQVKSTMNLIVASYNERSLKIKTIAIKALVDVVIQHDDLDVEYDRIKNILNTTLRNYGKYDITSSKEEMDFVTAVVRGTAKLYYFQKLSCADSLAHLVLWWYHPRTHPMLRQYIGVFLPLFVKHASLKKPKLPKPATSNLMEVEEEEDGRQAEQTKQDCNLDETDDDEKWLEEILSSLFVTCIEYLHSYILGPGMNVMDEGDMVSLTNFLCNLVPTTHHRKVLEAVDDRIEYLSDKDGGTDLVKYLKKSKKNLLDVKVQPVLEPKLEPFGANNGDATQSLLFD